MTTHDRLGQHGTKAGGQTGSTVGAAEEVGSSEERLVVIVETNNKDMVPKGVEFGTAAVEKLCEIAMKVCGVETGSIGGGVGLVERKLDEVAVEILHVGDVTAEAYN